MTTRKLIVNVHLWLGLASGLVIVILGITGCMLAFEREIRTVTNPEQFVTPQTGKYMPPEQLAKTASAAIGGRKINYLEYPGRDRSVIAAQYDAENYFIVALNPYDGKLIAVKDMNRDFFRIVLAGHFYLWLPPAIGQPIVASATLIFLIMLITGVILWWPKNKAARKQRFSVKWTAKWKRLNYDLHNVFGFYMTWVAIFIAVTGLVWGFEWFASGLYKVTALGKSMPAFVQPQSDTLRAGSRPIPITDSLWAHHLPHVGPTESIAVMPAQTNADPVEVVINHRPGTYYDTESFHYDQYSGVELPAPASEAGTFATSSTADQIKRLNYDIHVGAALGLPGKIMAFCASLIAASLPVTGFYIWWGRRKKNTSKPAKSRPALITS